MSRRTLERRAGSGFGRKLLFWLVVAGLIYWAGRDPSGAAAVLHSIGQGIAHFAHDHAAPAGGRS